MLSGVGAVIGAMRAVHRWTVISVAVALVLCIWAVFAQQSDSRSTAQTVGVPPRRADGFVTSHSCRPCHPGQYASWHQTYHRTMTQPATPETVIASFDNVRLQVEDQIAHLTRRANQFWVEMNDPAWERKLFGEWTRNRTTGEPDPFTSFPGKPPRVTAEVVMTTGSHHFQAYWVRGPGRELWQFPWRYNIAQKRWVHRKDVFLAPPQWRPGMWFRVWNHQCSICHSTGPYPGENQDTGVMENTEVAELGIACESCHGEGEGHVRLNLNPLRRYRKYLTKASDLSIIHPANLPHDRSSEMCGSCHAHFRHEDPEINIHGPQFRPGDELARFGSLVKQPARPQIMSRFWADGANRSVGREFSGMAPSACYQQGALSCTNCHSMHKSDPNDQLLDNAMTNEACYQCHDSYRANLAEHTRHADNSSGSLCYNCHMPHTNYGLFKAARSHRIDIPQVVRLESNTRPNACNLCHLDKPLGWTADRLQQWYGTEPPLLLQEERDVAAGLLWALRGDAGQRVIAAWHFGWEPARAVSGHQWMTPTLATLMNDPYAAVRWVAFDALLRAPMFDELKYDFDGPPAKRQEVADALMRQWTQRQESLAYPASERSQVMLSDQGELRSDQFDSILRRRDNRMIVGVE